MRRFVGWSVIPAACFVLLGLAWGSRAAQPIESLAQTVKLGQDGVLSVNEIWRYDFGLWGGDGVERRLPGAFEVAGRGKPISLDGLEVSDDRGVVLPHTLSRGNGDYVISIKNAEQRFVGAKIFRLTYIVSGAVVVSGDKALLNWQIAGGFREQVNNPSGKVILPFKLAESELKTDCRYGDANAPALCPVKITQTENETVAELSGIGRLEPGQTLTLSVEMPRKYLHKMTWLVTARNQFGRYWTWLLSLLAILAGLVWRKTWPKNPMKSSAYGLRYSPPTDLTPMETSMLLTGKADKRDLAADIFSLASNGLLTLELVGGQQGTDYFMRARGKPRALNDDYQQLIMESLFTDRTEVSLSVYLKELSERWPEITKSLKRGLHRKGLSNTKAKVVKLLFVALWAGMALLGWQLGNWLGLEIVSQAGLSSVGIVMGLFGLFRPAYSRLWLETMYGLKGFEHYLADRPTGPGMNQSVAPVRNSQLFEAYLPYALSLDESQVWASQFNDIRLSPPAWYVNPFWKGEFNPKLLADDLATLGQVMNEEELI